jgi:hypothetical protein
MARFTGRIRTGIDHSAGEIGPLGTSVQTLDSPTWSINILTRRADAAPLLKGESGSLCEDGPMRPL